MPLIDAQKRSLQWTELLEQKKDKTLIDLLDEALVVEVAEFLTGQDTDICVRLLALFTQDKQAELFGHFDHSLQTVLHDRLLRRDLAKILVHMPSDLRVDFYQKLTTKQRAQLLPYFPKAIQKDVITLSAYPPETAGGIMSTDFGTIGHHMTTRQALDKVREDMPSKNMMYVLYVVDEHMKMVGFVPLPDLVTSKPSTRIQDIVRDTFVFAWVDDNQESVAQKIEKYDLVQLPVLNDERQVIGSVSHDDAIEVIREEETKDMERFMGIVSHDHEENYLQTPVFQHFTKRVAWLTSLLIVGSISGYMMVNNRLRMAFPILACFIPFMNDTAGNAGSQSAMVVIRALALGQVSLKDWFIILLKELKIALLSIGCLAILAFLRVVLIPVPKKEPTELLLQEPDVYTLALIVTLSISLQMLTATVIGAMLPLFVKWFKKDPALAASPAITTIVDIVGVFIYFKIATWFLM